MCLFTKIAFLTECERCLLLLAINMALLTECERCLLLLAINMALERQEKLGVSDWVEVPVEKV